MEIFILLVKLSTGTLHVVYSSTNYDVLKQYAVDNYSDMEYQISEIKYIHKPVLPQKEG